MSQSKSLVLYEIDGKVATISLNRPEKRNALSRALWVELDEVMARADADPDIRIIILTGVGPSFCAGADIAGDEDPTTALGWHRHNQKHLARQFRIRDSNKTYIAAVDGYALGRGLELALWCDIVVASADAKLGMPEIRQALVLQSVIPWFVSPQHAKLFLLSGDIIDAAEAERLGIVCKVAGPGEAKAEAAKMARRLSHIPPFAAESVKRMVNGVFDQLGMRQQQAAAIAASSFNAHLSPEDKGIAELHQVGIEQGFKAWLKFRDAPFNE
jgi:enoyl-CoA hydratase